MENFLERWYTVKWIRILKTIEGGAFMNSIQEFWKLLLEHFEKTNSEFTFNHWIKPAEPIRIELVAAFITSLSPIKILTIAIGSEIKN